MGRPKGSVNKPKEGALTMVQDASIVLPPILEERRAQVRYDLTLSIRAFRTGNWKGLWELTKVDNDGKRTIIVDATSRQSVINMVNRQIMKMVIA